MRRRILSVLLILLMMVTLFPTTALAGAELNNVVDGIRGIDGSQESNLYFGTYPQSSNGSGSYNTDPIKWRVLDDNGSYYARVYNLTAEEFAEATYYIFDAESQEFVAAGEYDADAAYYEARDSMVLLADQGLDNKPYDAGQTYVPWESGTVRSWLNGYDAADENGDNVVNPYEDSFLDTAFSSREQTAIAEAALSDSVRDKVYFLAADVVDHNFNFDSDSDRMLYKTDYVSNILDDGFDTAGWWLRSGAMGTTPGTSVDFVSYTGEITDCNANYGYVAVRPAINIDLDSVLFSTAADFNNSTPLARTETYAGDDWKLTLKDGNISFDVSMAVTTIFRGGTAAVEIENLGHGADYSQISAMLLRSGDIQAYGKIGDACTGEATFTVPADLFEGDYTLRIFAEEVNGNRLTDYASNTVDIPVTVTADSPDVFVGGQNVSEEAGAITYWLNDGDGGITDTGADAESYNVKYDGSSRTLTLRNANLTSVHSDYLSLDDEYLSSSSVFTLWNLRIVLEGENRIEPSSGSGVITVRGLDFSGDGSLSIDADDYIEAIYVRNGDIDIHGGCISANGSIGISASNEDINVYGGSVSVAGPYHGIYSYEGNVNVYGGTVNATGLNSHYSYGVAAYEGNVAIFGGTVIAKAVGGSNYCYGVYANGDAEILGGALFAQGGTEAVFSWSDVSPSAAYEKCAVIMTKEDEADYAPTVLYNSDTAPAADTGLWLGGFPFCRYDTSLWIGVEDNAVYGDYFHDEVESTADGEYTWRAEYNTNDSVYNLILNGISIKESYGYGNQAGIFANENVDLILEGDSSIDVASRGYSHWPSGIFMESGSLRIDGIGSLDISALFNTAISARSGNVTIEGGTINAVSGNYSAGIDVWTGNVTINGGTVCACGGGTGVVANNGTITVTGGTLTAKGGATYGTILSGSEPVLTGTAILEAETGGSVSGGVYTGGTSVSDLNSITWREMSYQADNTIVTSMRIARAYAVTCEEASNGSFTSKIDGSIITHAAAGDTVTLAAVPASGYLLSLWNVYKTGDATTVINVTEDSFTMPAYAVTVEASFTPEPPLNGDSPSSSSGGSSLFARTITVTETSSGLFNGAQGAVKAEANMMNAFSNSVEVKVTDTDKSSSVFGLGIGNDVYPFDISLYIKGTNTKTEPKEGYAVMIALPVPNDLLDRKEQLSIAHKADDGRVTTLASQLKQSNGVWYLIFEATEFSPYALVVSSTGIYAETEGLPYYMGPDENEVFIGFAANGKYIAASGVTVLFKENAKSFMDIGSHWAKHSIGFITERELFLGTGRDTFSPDSGMTRAMFATVVGRLYERSYGEIETMSIHAFTDCDYDEYYGKYVDWAADNGVLDGYGNGQFGPGDPVTREQMAAVLHRFAELLGILSKDMDAALNYPDADAISGWAQSAALYCQNSGIITGREGGSFVPKGTVTRAEVAVILERFIKYRLS